MAKFKPYDYGQMKLVPVSFERQILPGSFEAALSRLIDEEIDLAVFDARYRNDAVGAPAYDPAILLKVILAAYARGITSSREIARLCRENVLFMALAADSAPHFTTIADFIATLDREIVAVFRDVLLVCDELGLIGREMFAVDGVKLPSNAAKEWSGTRGDFDKKIAKMERAVEHLVGRHREADAAGADAPLRAARGKQIDTLTGHVILAGLGRVGGQAALEIKEAGVPFVVVDPGRAAARKTEERGYPLASGDRLLALAVDEEGELRVES